MSALEARLERLGGAGGDEGRADAAEILGGIGGAEAVAALVQRLPTGFAAQCQV